MSCSKPKRCTYRNQSSAGLWFSSLTVRLDEKGVMFTVKSGADDYVSVFLDREQLQHLVENFINPVLERENYKWECK